MEILLFSSLIPSLPFLSLKTRGIPYISPKSGEIPSLSLKPREIPVLSLETITSSSSASPFNKKALSAIRASPKASPSGEEDPSVSPLGEEDAKDSTYHGFEIRIDKTGKNSRRIRARIWVDASLDTIWSVLTDYQKLSDFIPGLAVSRLLEKNGKWALLYQIGQQNLAFGLKFDAKGIVECYENDVEFLSFGRRRDIDFNMVEGDFHTFRGKWSIVQAGEGIWIDGNISGVRVRRTILTYFVDVVPKRWLPVALVEGRLCREIELNLQCIREVASKTDVDSLSSF
ncbi:hypothetical protein AMTRI_Chr02g265860 [Amborella trichopoda]|uniref:Coenzyme Q-binding protein COQ10 START domain-containing protein n=1 Tax=Amborella trichopoda TaxID=13333 RepID=W1P370_AMBTC|nr:uncharacterized protein LOC18430197 [Amborella trichopoda]ERN02094.1 hypothetical protein AMTR_s00045p00157760 [Amborella trichopoda]|eukprot:XP_006840419.1 uncharacterized protein LOC18430197 [Amborella trichopoda]